MKHAFQRTLALILALMTLLSVTTAFASGKTVAINKKNFPDAVFRKYVKSFDKNKDGKLSAKEIKEVEEIGLANRRSISSLKGIEFFTSLEYLNCSGNKLTTLDVSKNTKLTELHCNANKLKKLDVSRNTRLNLLNCAGNKLTKLKLGKNSKLREFCCIYNNLTSIDIGGCKLLKKFVSNSQWIVDNDGTVVFMDDGYYGDVIPGLQYDKKTKLMNGKKLLRKYAKPKSIKFTKNSVTLKVHDEEDLMSLLKITPSTCVYPIKFSCAPTKIIEFVCYEEENMARWFEGINPGTTTITAKCGGKTAKLKVTVE